MCVGVRHASHKHCTRLMGNDFFYPSQNHVHTVASIWPALSTRFDYMLSFLSAGIVVLVVYVSVVALPSLSPRLQTNIFALLASSQLDKMRFQPPWRTHHEFSNARCQCLQPRPATRSRAWRGYLASMPAQREGRRYISSTSTGRKRMCTACPLYL